MSITDSNLFKHDEFLRTPLANAIINENEEEIELLLNNGAAKTMFVKGYSASSIVCTLPQAKQPKSRCFNHPDPFEKSSSKVIDLLDSFFAQHIENMVKKKIDEKVEKSISIDAAGGDDDDDCFVMFPIKLKKNDRVERGPQWKSTGNEDGNGEGVVISDDTHPTYLVNWDNKRKGNYTYNSTVKNFELQLVDPSKSTSKLNSESYQVGDIVSVNFDAWNALVAKQLNSSSTTHTGTEIIVNNKDLTTSICKSSCLGTDYNNSKYGIIINCEKKSNNPNESLWKVASLANGNCAHYKGEELNYGDGSSRGRKPAILMPNSSIKKKVEIVGGHVLEPSGQFRCRTCNMNGPSNETGGSHCSSCQLCVVCCSFNRPCTSLSPHNISKAVQSSHKIIGQNNNPYNSYSTSSIKFPIKCEGPCSGNIPSKSCSNFHCSVCKFCALCSASNPICNSSTNVLSLLKLPMPQAINRFSVGDRVQISTTFKMNSGNGWCLGNVGSGVVGIVQYASEPISAGQEQRNIIVSSTDNSSDCYYFRGSWLRLSPNAGEVIFKIGDRVQLDRSTYIYDGDMSGKCLGNPDNYLFGIVSSVGPIRDSIQRNIEVHLPDVFQNVLSNFRVSLYSSHHLVKAERSVVLLDSEKSSLCQSVTNILSNEIGFYSNLINKSGLKIWSAISAYLPPSVVIEGMQLWQKSRDLSDWNDSSLMKTIIDKTVYNNSINSSFDSNEIDWICSICKYPKNSISKIKCVTPRCKGIQNTWKCLQCTAENKLKNMKCKLCKSNKNLVNLHEGKWKIPFLNNDNCYDLCCLNKKSEDQSALDKSKICSGNLCLHDEDMSSVSHWSCCGGINQNEIVCNNKFNLNTQSPIVVDFTIKPVVDPVVETIVEPVVGTIIEPVVETIVETVVKPVVEPVVDKNKYKVILGDFNNNGQHRVLSYPSILSNAEKMLNLGDIIEINSSAAVEVDNSGTIITFVPLIDGSGWTKLKTSSGKMFLELVVEGFGPTSVNTILFGSGTSGVGSGGTSGFGALPNFIFTNGQTPGFAGTSGFSSGTSGFSSGTSEFGSGTSGFGSGTSGFGSGTSGFGTGTSGFGSGTSGFSSGETSGFGSPNFKFGLNPIYAKPVTSNNKKLHKNKSKEVIPFTFTPEVDTNHKFMIENSRCKICVNCSKCTGYGDKCCIENNIQGSDCGCGYGCGGCVVCGECQTCCNSHKLSCTNKFISLVGETVKLNFSLQKLGLYDVVNVGNKRYEYDEMKNELQREVSIAEDSDDSDEDKDQTTTILPSVDDEIEKNRIILESKHITNKDKNIFNSNSISDLGPPDLLPPPVQNEKLGRQLSLDFTLTESFEEVSNLVDLLTWIDKNGSTCCHYLASIKFPKSYKAIITAGASNLISNKFNETPQGIIDGVDFTSNHSIQLHSIFCKRQNIPLNILKYALITSKYFKINEELVDIEDAILNRRTNDALLWSESAVTQGIQHAELYYAIALLESGFSASIAKIQIENYEKNIASIGEVDPIYFYCKYFLWQKEGSIKKKIIRLTAADNLSICRLFPSLEDWLQVTDTVDLDVIKEGLENNIEIVQIDDDSDSDDEDDSQSPDSPESQWKLAKTLHNGESKSMDNLMKLTGLKKIKNQAVNVFKNVLLTEVRKKAGLQVNSDTTMNFLFVGNPGCGKTTVATAFAAIMTELGLRKNPDPIVVTAVDILADGPDEFAQLCAKAKGGTLFIDEAYQIKPSAKGSSPGPANTILDILLKVSEEERLTTTFILAGYKEEILELLTYNDGFKSRFPIIFDFDDYTPKQLKMIFKNMIKEKNFILESKKDCGVPIAKIAAARIGKGAGKKGFGNARAVREFIGRSIQDNTDRVGALLLHGVKCTDKELSVLSRVDILGNKPDIENSPLLKDLNKMIGLSKVKEQIRGLMCLQLQNFESEIRGEKISEICLHRMFIGNPGTGKTTVAQIYGSLLKEFGLLSNGDVMKVVPSDLMGSAVGSSEELTKKIVKQAEGKVLFIDEAYILDPTRGKGVNYGAEVLDTLVSLLDASAGSDMAVILAGYSDEMDSLCRNANPGFRRRFQPEESIIFDDYSDVELQKILLYMVNKNELIIMPSTAKKAIDIISESRRMPKFGNAGTVENYFGRAKVNRSKRIELASKLRYSAIAQGKPIPVEPHPKEIFIEDFVNEVTSIEKARETLNDLYNIDHINVLLEEFEVTIKAAIRDEIPIGQILSENHMIFLGPPGTGKTTIAKKFGFLLKQLKLLPTDKVTVTSGNDLAGQYVGQTKVKVLELMRQAQGGILFIDEAYSMLPERHTFSNEVIQALLTYITTEEFSGNLLIIMAGYETEMNNLFKKCNNPGFQSRFDKRRINFPSWTASQATEVTLKLIHKSNKTITPTAQELLLELYGQLSRLPNWASARDVTQNIINALYVKRNLRLSLEEKVKNRLKADLGKPDVEVVTDHKKKSNRRQMEAIEETPPYTTDDVLKAFENTLSARGGSIHRTTHASSTVKKTDSNFVSSNGSNNSIIDKSSSISHDNHNESMIIIETDYVNVNIDESNSDDDLYSEIGIIDSNQDLTDEINESIINNCLLIVNYKSKSCKSCRNITIFLNKIVDENSDVRIISVDADKYRDLSTKMGINTVPTCVFYINGKIIDKLVSGDEKLLMNKFTECSHLVIKNIYKNKSNLQSSDTTTTTNNNNIEEDNFGPQQPQHNFKHNYAFKKNDPNQDKDDKEDKPDVWAALEEACNKLNVSLDELKIMLESKEFSPEIIAMIKSITGCDDTAELLQMLEPQRAPALERVNKLIKEALKVKSEIEKKKQAKIKALGRCPMDFEWLRVDGGYQCAGGSHSITDAQVGEV